MGSYVEDECLHDLVAVGHVGDHVRHVVLGRPHQRGAEHQGQVPGFHLDSRHSSQPPPAISTPLKGHVFSLMKHGGLRVELNTQTEGMTHLVLIGVISHLLEMAHQVSESVVVVIWQVLDLRRERGREGGEDREEEERGREGREEERERGEGGGEREGGQD